MTYRQTYQLFLEQLLAAGGTPKHMSTVVQEFNNIENPNYQPSKLFTDFVEGLEHRCSTCGCGFHTGNIQIDEETTCDRCR